MQNFATSASAMTGACGALTLSLVLIGQAVSAPQADGTLCVASACVGAVA